MKLIDLSHPISNAMPTYPSDPDISIIREKDIDTDNTLLHSFKMGTHTGTHLDVPAHVIPGGKTLNNFSLTSFTGTAVKVDEISYNSLEKLEGVVEGVIYDTGWYRHFNDAEVFYGPDRPQIPEKLIEIVIKMGYNFLVVTCLAWTQAAQKKNQSTELCWGKMWSFMNYLTTSDNCQH